jgi:hypothetical protein
MQSYKLAAMCEAACEAVSSNPSPLFGNGGQGSDTDYTMVMAWGVAMQAAREGAPQASQQAQCIIKGELILPCRLQYHQAVMLAVQAYNPVPSRPGNTLVGFLTELLELNQG